MFIPCLASNKQDALASNYKLISMEINSASQETEAKDVLSGLPAAAVALSLRATTAATPQIGADVRRCFDEMLRGDRTRGQAPAVAYW